MIPPFEPYLYLSYSIEIYLKEVINFNSYFKFCVSVVEWYLKKRIFTYVKKYQSVYETDKFYLLSFCIVDIEIGIQVCFPIVYDKSRKKNGCMVLQCLQLECWLLIQESRW